MPSPESFQSERSAQFELHSKYTPEERIDIGRKMLKLRLDVLAGDYDGENEDLSLGEKINLEYINRGDYDELIAEAKEADREETPPAPEPATPGFTRGVNRMLADLQTSYRTIGMSDYDRMNGQAALKRK